MMKSYTAYCMNEDGENMCMTREYNGKKDFMSDLHGNGYKVHFIALTDNYDEECAKYYERLEQKRRISAIRRECEREWKRRDAEFEKAVAEAVAEEEPTTEEPAQEAETMRFKKDYFNFITKKIEKYNCIRFDSDIEFYVTNCTEKQEPAAIRKAVEKFIEELKKNENTDILVDSLEMMYNCNEFDQRSTFNEIKNGGNAYEIEVNRYNDKTLSIYIRICEHGDDITQEEIDRVFEEEIIKEFENEQAEKLEETKPEETENQEEEKPAENPTDSAFITEMFAALEYFKRVLWNYTEAEGGTRSERDISGDFWGAHECGVILSFVNNRLKAQGAEPYYKLKNDFDSLTECFEEIMQKFEYGDERTIEEIISEYNFS